MRLFKRHKDTINDMDTTSKNDKRQRALYIVAERNIVGVTEFLAKYGLYVQKFYTDIEEAKIGMLVENRPTRLVIVESGLGKFISTSKRRDLVDLIGMCDGTDKEISVFYTNSLLKTDATKEIGRKGHSIQWNTYRGTMEMIRDLLSLKEAYIEKDAEQTMINRADILAFKGYSNGVTPHKHENVFNIIEALMGNNSDEGLPKYKISV